MPDEVPPPATSQQMSELIAAVQRLSGLEEALNRLLQLQEAPGVSDRVEAFITELGNIRKQLERGVTALEAARPAEEVLQELKTGLAQQAVLSRQIVADLHHLMNTLATPLRAPRPPS